MKNVYVAIAPDGSILGTQNTADEAVEMAQEMAPHTTLAVEKLPEQQNPDDDEAALAKTDPKRMPWSTMRKLGLDPIDESCMDMSLEEAHKRLAPFFQGLTRTTAEVEVKKYDTVAGMVDGWIGSNFKMGKGAGETGDPDLDRQRRAAEVMGLALVPAAHPRQAAHNEGSYAAIKRKDWPGIDNMRKRWRREFGDSKFVTWCNGSNSQCRETCLVFAGQNAAERYNTERKVAQSMALLNEPRAFLRILVESIERWLDECEFRHSEVDPYFRLNVLSDIPWERLAPWLFGRFARRRGTLPMLPFYDYTKVPGRATGPGTPFPNYDLTFSFSGTNFKHLLHDFDEYHRRFSVVLVGLKIVGKRPAQWQTIGVKGERAINAVPLPKTFWGVPVVDGDISDVRPRDRDSVCVALRYKTPSAKRSGVEIDPLAQDMTFITPVFQTEAGEVEYYSAELAKRAKGWAPKLLREAPNEEWLLSAHTPRNQPIKQQLAQLVG